MITLKTNNVEKLPIGIDLGTTNSVMAVHKKNKTDIIPFEGENITPSCVFYHPDGDEVSIGELDASDAARLPTNLIYDSKRLIGRSFQDASIQNYQSKFLFKIEPTKLDGIRIPIQQNDRTIYKTPKEVSSEILKAFKREASNHLGYEVDEAVITVPAYFTFAQRTATKEAANLAGLKVLMLMNEPTAACLHYLSKKSERNLLSLVFDLGGGTLDISIVRYTENGLKVVSVDGDTFLGGRNFDEAVFEHFVKDGNLKNLTTAQRRRLLTCSEKFKIDLSHSKTVSKVLEYFEKDKKLNLKLSREKFEEINNKLFEKCVDTLKRSLSKAGLKKEDIGKVILVGGSTKIPKVKNIVQEFFDNKPLSNDLNPGLAIALGAAIKAATIKGLTKQNISMQDVTPFSLGINIAFGAMKTIIKSNSLIPIKSSTRVETSNNFQKQITLKIYEGERPQCKLNNFLGTLSINNLPKKPAGEVKVEVTFSLDESGLLKITTEELSSGNSLKLEVDIELNDLRNTNMLSLIETIEDDNQFLKFVEIKTKTKRQCNKFISRNGTNKSDISECRKLNKKLEEVDFQERAELSNIIKSFVDKLTDKELRKQLSDCLK